MDERLGTCTPRRWPKVDIRGGTYERHSVTEAGIGGGYFVVLPIGYVDADGALAALRREQAAAVSGLPVEINREEANVPPIPSDEEAVPPTRRKRVEKPEEGQE